MGVFSASNHRLPASADAYVDTQLRPNGVLRYISACRSCPVRIDHRTPEQAQIWADNHGHRYIPAGRAE